MQSILSNTRRPDITLHASGLIDISAHVAKLLSLHPGDVLDVIDCGDRELYLYVKFRAPVVGRHEATCFPSHSGGRHTRAWSRRLCLAIMQVGGYTGAKLPLAVGDPVTLRGEAALPIIYKHPLNKQKT